MSTRCFGPEDLDSILEGTATEEQRAHAKECLACRMLLAEYRSFLEAAPAAGADPRAASARLDRVLDPDSRTDGGVIRPWPGFFKRRSTALGLAAACIAAALVLAILPRGNLTGEGPSGLLRSESVEQADFQISVLHLDPDASLTVAWNAATDADSYRIEVLGAGLAVVHEQKAGTDLEASLAPASWQSAGGPFFVRVVALKSGAEIERTPLRELPATP